MSDTDDEILGQKETINGDELADTGPVVVTITGKVTKEFDNGTVKFLTFDNGRRAKLGPMREQQLAELFTGGKPFTISQVVGKQIKLVASKMQTPAGRKNVVNFEAADGKAPF